MRQITIFLLFTILTAGTIFAQDNQLKTVIQKGHEAVVKTARFTLDGKYLLSGSRDKTIKMWETSTRREVKSFKGHLSTINDLEISNNGKLFITSSADRTAKVWDIKSGELLFSTPADRDYMTTVAFSADDKLIATGGYEPKVKIWDYKKNELIKEIDSDPDRGLGYGINLDFSPDGKLLAIGEDNKKLSVYSTITWDTVYTVKIEGGSCGGCATFTAFTHDSRYVVRATNNGIVAIYDAATGKRKIKISDKVEDIRAVSFNKDDSRLMAATEKVIYQWDMKDGSLYMDFYPDVKEVNDASYSPDGSQIVVSGNDNKATLWSAENGDKIGEFSGILQEVDKGGINYDPDNYWQSHLAKYVRLKSRIVLTKDGKQLIRGKFGKLAKKWDLKSGEEKVEYRGHDKAVLSVALNNDGTRLITGDGDGKVIVWDADTGDSLMGFDRHRGPVWDIQFSHDQQKMVTVSWDGYALIYDVKTGELLSDIYFDNRSAFSVSFTPNDLYIIVGLLDKKLEMFEIDTKKSVREFIGHLDVVSEIDMHTDHNKMLTVSWDGSARIWDLNSGMIISKFTSKRPLYTGLFSESQQAVLVAGESQEIHLLDESNLQLKQSLQGHQSDIVTIQLNEAAGLMVSNSLDGVVKIWDLDKKKEFFEHIHIGKNDWMVKSRQGYFNATDGARRVIHFVKGNKTYSADQFFNDFYRPDLIPNLFSVRGAGQSEGILQKINKFPPPEVKLALKPSADLTTSEVYIKSIDQGGGFRSLKLFHNGKRLNVDKPESSTNKEGRQEWISRLTVPLVGGKNLFGVIGVSKGGTESQLVEKEVHSNQKVPSANCYIFAIGINDYQNNSLDLGYARSDASAFVEVIKKDKQQLFNQVHVTTLYDQEATKENILKSLDNLTASVGINDVFIFYYAGHGSVVDNRFFFIPTETSRLFDIKSLQKSALEASVLQEKFKSIKALKQVIIMDACQSGESAELLAQRGSVEEKAIAQLSRSAGIHVLASAGSDQFASEFKELQHGLFTYVLLKALNGAADGTPKEGKVTLFELKSYLDDQVPEMSMEYKGKPQYPYTFSKGNDFPLRMVTNPVDNKE